MIDHPATADPHPADVFSLGKTLWVLSTDQNWPPLGHQTINSSGFGIADFRRDRNAGRLDELVERMTRHVPEQRPTKAQVASDLAAWLELSEEPVLLDLSEWRSRFRTKLQGVISEAENEARLREAQQRAIRRLQELTKPLNDQLKYLFDTKVQVDLSHHPPTINTVKSYLDVGGRAELLHRWHRCTLVSLGDYATAPGLAVSRSVELFRDGRLAFTWMVDASPQSVMHTWYSEGPIHAVAPAESVEVDRMLETQVQALAAALEKALAAFYEALPDS